jgi:adenosylcobinamide kinase/adenosylcobinamide-phosphate guanylyltransferase
MNFAFMGEELTMQETRQGSVTLVLGGVRSGKSRYAQQLAGQSRHVVFVATARVTDEEMRAKIERHREDRPKEWLTIEEPLDLPKVLAEHELDNDVVVVDCLTVYAANLLEAEGEDRDALERRVQTLCDALQVVNSRVIVVSNEVGSGVHPVSPLGRTYRDLLGEINQRVASIADDVVLMVAGLPLALKGHLEVTQ